MSLGLAGALLAAAALSSERDDNALVRLRRGLVSPAALVCAKVAYAAIACALVGAALLGGVALLTSLAVGRWGWWALALALAGVAFGAFGVLVGALARETRTALLAALMAALPLLALALLPGGGVAGALAALVPFGPAFDLFQSLLADPELTGSVGRGMAHLAALAAVFGAAAAVAVARTAGMRGLPAFRMAPTDGVVRLREWRPADVADMTAACRDPEIARWTMVPDDYREADARAFIAGRDAARRAGEALDAAVVDAVDGGLLGAVALTALDWRHERAEVGYWVAPWARGRGVATRAVRLLAAWTFTYTEIGRLDLMTYIGNAASERVAERAGFVREGVLRGFYLAKDGRRDVTMFGLLRPNR